MWLEIWRRLSLGTYDLGYLYRGNLGIQIEKGFCGIRLFSGLEQGIGSTLRKEHRFIRKNTDSLQGKDSKGDSYTVFLRGCGFPVEYP
jgi:hypothetical protein